MNKVYLIGRDDVPGKLILGREESMNMAIIVLPGVSAELHLEIELAAPGAELFLSGLYLCPGEEKLSFDISVRHSFAGCSSRQLFKGIVGGKARCDFNGLIYVARDSQKTKAFQENHNILLSEAAHVETRPQLEIYADDVECSHGATVGKLDEQELFYMRSRGIPEVDAKVLQMISFISPIVDKIDDETLREQIYDSLSEC